MIKDELRTTVKKAFHDATVFSFAKMAMVDIADSPGPFSGEIGISAIIGFSGDFVGNCVIRMSEDTAQQLITRLTGESVEAITEINDGIGEFVNMIAGNAKAALESLAVNLSFPEVIRGKGHEIGFHRHQELIQHFFTSDIGDITVIAAFLVPESQ